MKITLNNGQELNLKITPLILEYLDDYADGGMEGIQSDIKSGINLGYVTNWFIYSLIVSNMDEPIRYRDALGLINLRDVEQLADFAIANIEDLPKLKEVKDKHFR